MKRLQATTAADSLEAAVRRAWMAPVVVIASMLGVAGCGGSGGDTESEATDAVTLHGAPEAFEFDAETKARQKLVLVALAKAPADLVIENARVLNVHTLSWVDAQDIVIAEGRIAWVGPAGEWGGEAEELSLIHI